MNARQMREARGWAGYSRRELAGLLGVHPDTVANWETGRTRAPYRLRWHLALLLGEPLPGGYWDGWILRGDTLWSPANQGFKATELSYLWLTFEMARLWKARERPALVAAIAAAPDIPFPAEPLLPSGRADPGQPVVVLAQSSKFHQVVCPLCSGGRGGSPSWPAQRGQGGEAA